MTVQKMYTEKQVLTNLQRKKALKMTLRDIAAEYDGITFGDIARALEGQFPKSKEKRAAMRLKPLVEVEGCNKCGEAHPIKHPRTRKPPTRWADMSVAAVRWAIDNREEMR